MTNQYDVIIVGGGHNGLVAAAYLAKAGVKVLVLEKRPFLGGVGVTEEIYPGFRVDTLLHNAGTFRPQVVRDLFLKMHNFEMHTPDPVVFAPLPDGNHLTLWQDVGKTTAEIGRFSATDAAKFRQYSEMMGKYAAFIETALSQVPPNIGQLSPGSVMPWLGVGRGFLGLGGHDMYGLLRLLPMSVEEFLSEWFENEVVQGVLAAPGITAIQQGPYSGGTVYVMLHHHLGHRLMGLPSTSFIYGGMSKLSEALASAARQFGAMIRQVSPVSRIVVKNGRSTGVALEDGEEISAKIVLSTASPRHTFTELIDPYELDTNLVRAVRNIKFRGAVAKVNLALSGLPNFTALRGGSNSLLYGRIQISPSLAYLDEAYNAAKYGEFSKRPYLDIRIPSLTDPTLAPTGQHVMSIQAQYAPYKLRQGNWADQREALRETVLDTLAQYAPNIRDLILYCQVLTPADLEETYGLAEGHLYHGELMLDQLLFMRPTPDCGQYRTPIHGLYLGGAGSHPGGGITGEPGRLAAQEILRDIKK